MMTKLLIGICIGLIILFLILLIPLTRMYSKARKKDELERIK